MKLFNYMKNVVLSRGVTAIVGCLLFAGCADDNSSVASDSELFEPSFYTSSGVISKSIVNGTGDTPATDIINEVGVYITKADHTNYPSMTDRSSLWTFADKTWTSTSTIGLGAFKGLVYAYSPASLTVTDGAETTDAHTVSVTVAKDQTYNGANAWECSGVDYLYGLSTKNISDAEVIEVHNKSNKPAIFLYHALTQVVFKMHSAPGRAQNTTYDYVKSVTISSVDQDLLLSGTGTMKIKDGTIESLTSVNELKFSPQAGSVPVISGVTGSPSIIAYGVVSPSDLSSADKITVTVVLGKKDSDLEDRILSVSHENFKQIWTKGNKYIYNLTLGDRKIEVSQTSIATWTEFTGNGDMNPDGF